METLEPRLLLTAVVGGDTFEYLASDPMNYGGSGSTVQIRLTGNIVAEVIGVDIDDANNVLLGDLPGLITGLSGGGVLGGLGGAAGTYTIGSTPITDPLPGNGIYNIPLPPTGNPNIAALASGGVIDGGKTYGLNFGQTPGDNPITVAQLVQLNNTNGAATVAAELQGATLKNDLMSSLNDGAGHAVTLTGVQAFTVDPVTGLGYAVSSDGAGGLKLSQVNRYTGTVTDLGTLTYNGATPVTNITGAAFSADGTLYLLSNDYDGNPNPNPAAAPAGDASGIPTSITPGTPPALPTETFAATDPAVIKLGSPSAGTLNVGYTQADAISLTKHDENNQVVESTDTYTALAINPTTGIAYLAASGDSGGSSLQKFDFATVVSSPNPQVLVSGVGSGTISTGAGGPTVSAMAFGKTINTNTGAYLDSLIATGSVVSGEDISSILLRVNTGDPGASTALAPLDTTAARGLGTYTEPGDANPLLFAISTDGKSVVRGSSLSLPLTDAGTTGVTSIDAAAFNPIDGLLYFTLKFSGGSGDAANVLYVINPNLGNTSAIQNSLIQVPGKLAGAASDVTAITFDQTGATRADLLIYDAGAVGGNGAVVRLANFNKANSDSFSDTADLAGDNVIEPIIHKNFYGARITGMTLINDDPSGADGFVYAVDNSGAASQLIRVRLVDQIDRPGAPTDDTNVYIMGPLTDPSGQTATGNNIQDLTWNPLLRDPITGTMGTLLGTDTGVNALLALDKRPRFPNANAFAIYITQSDTDSGITISITSGNAEDPYVTGSPLQFRVVDASTGNLVLVSAQANTGGMVIGAQTEDLDVDSADELVPIISGALTDFYSGQTLTNIGTMPVPDGDLTAGFTVTPTLESFLPGNSLEEQAEVGGTITTGQNLSNLVGLAVSRDGQNVVAVDNDGWSDTGATTTGGMRLGAEVAMLDPFTGKALGTPVALIDALTGLPIYGVSGLAYGDTDLNVESGQLAGTTGETLYGVFDQLDVTPGQDLGAVDFGTATPIASVVSPSGSVFVAAQDGADYNLYRVDRKADGTVDGTPTLLGRIVSGFNAVNPTDPQFASVTALTALALNPVTNQLYAIAEDPNTGQPRLMQVGQAGADYVPSVVGDEVLATPIGTASPGNVTAIAFGADGTLYGATAANFVTINTTTGAATNKGGLGGRQITALTYTPDGVLLGVDATNNQVVRINTTSGAITAVTTAGAINAGTMAGYSVDINDLFYTIQGGQLRVSSGTVPIFGTLDPGSGLVTQITDNSGVIGNGIKAMAFGPAKAGQLTLYAIDSTDELYQLSYTLDVNGDIASIDGSTDLGTVVDTDGDPVNITSMGFDRSGTLYGLDHDGGRLVDIALKAQTVGGVPYTAATAGIFTATDTGSIRATVGAIAFDYTNNRFLAADNFTSADVVTAKNKTGLKNRVKQSATLMQLTGVQNSSQVKQSIDYLLTGGAVLGNVSIAGSIDRFYAGWVLTGDATGIGLIDTTVPDNFYVGGNLGTLVSLNPVGTSGVDSDSPTYLTGFDLHVVGKLAQLYASNDLTGQITVDNATSIDGLDALTTTLLENENKDLLLPGITDAALFAGGFLHDGGNDPFSNDTFDTAEPLGSLRTGVPGQDDFISVDGALSANGAAHDNVDYYSVGLLAGQTITIQLNTGGAPMNIGVFDPSGRLIATDYSNQGSVSEPFQVTATMPGEYRFAIAWTGDTAFTGTGGGIPFSTPYNLSITGAGDLAVGGLRVGGNYIAYSDSSALVATQGDVGGVRAAGSIFDLVFNNPSYNVLSGNFRSLDGGNVGFGTTFGYGPQIAATGAIGLARSNGAIGDFELLQAGGDVQEVDTLNGNLIVNVFAGGGLGNVRAKTMIAPASGAFGKSVDNFIGSPLNSNFYLNTDGVGRDGILDLIDDAGDLQAPYINTGPGGNVRFVRVGGEIINAELYGGREVEGSHAPGVATAITDDSGVKFSISPAVIGNEPLGTGLNPQPINDKYLTIRTLGVANGGEVIVDVTSTGGVTVTANGNRNDARAEIGTIIVDSTDGRAVTTDDNGNLILDPDATTDVSVSISSNGSPVDVFNIVGGMFTAITNSTGGDILGISGISAGGISSAGNIGLTQAYNGAALMGVAGNSTFTQSDAYPWVNQYYGLNLTGDVIGLRADGAVGNVYIAGQVGSITANADRKHTSATGNLEGIAAPVVVNDKLGTINIGEGVAPTGTGLVGFAGIFAADDIGLVTNAGNYGSNIRGAVISQQSLNNITLTNGSIIQAVVGSLTDYDMVSPVGEAPFSHDDPTQSFENHTDNIGQININGNGGIIGSVFYGAEVGNITVKGGFGILETYIATVSLGVIGNITADGYGIRDLTIVGGFSIGNITATGKGTELSPTLFSDGVRLSENASFDPGGLPLTEFNDLHTFLGTSLTHLSLPDVTLAGLIEDIDATATDSLGVVSAYRIDVIGSGTNTLNFGNAIAGVKTIDSITGLTLTTGRLGYFRPGSDVNSSVLTVAGTLKTVVINGNFAGDSALILNGPSSSLSKFTVAGDMQGMLKSSGSVGKVSIGGDLDGSIIIDGATGRNPALKSFTLGGSMAQGSFDIAGDVGTIRVGGSLGDPAVLGAADLIHIDGDLGSLRVGTAKGALGSVLGMDVVVDGDLDSLTVNGRMAGDLTVRGSLGSLTVAGDSTTGFNAAPAPAYSVGNLNNGSTTDFNIDALAALSNGFILAFNNNGSGYDLLQITRQMNGLLIGGTNIATVAAGLNIGGTDIHNISAATTGLDTAGNTRVYFTGTLGAGTAIHLFSLDPANPTADPADLGQVQLGVTGLDTAAGYSIGGIAFDNAGTSALGDDRLYAVVHNATTSPFPSDQLVTLNRTSAAATIVGAGHVLVAGIDTQVTGLAMVSQNGVRELIAINAPQDGAAQTILLNTTDPTASTALSAPGTVDDNVAGITGDGAGHVLGVYNDPSTTPIDQVWTSDYRLIAGAVKVSGTVGNVTVTGGWLGGALAAGSSINNVKVTGGGLDAGARISSALGGINSVSFTGGDVLGDLAAPLGSIGKLTADRNLLGHVSAQQVGNVTLGGSMVSGSGISSTAGIDTLNIAGDVQASTTRGTYTAPAARITTPTLDTLNLGGNFAGALQVSNPVGSTTLNIGGNYLGTASLASSAAVKIAGGMGMFGGAPVAGTTLNVGGDLSATVGGDLSGLLVVRGNITSLSAAAIGNADANTEVLAGFDIARLSVTGAIERSLIQAGFDAGTDYLAGSGDFGETQRMANLGTVTAGSIGDSVLQAGLGINSVTVAGAVSNSSLSTGLVVSQTAAKNVISGADNLISNQTDVRSDEKLFRGDFGQFSATGGLIASALSAGVDPGADGQFGTGDDTVLTSVTGGTSGLLRATATLDGGSSVVTDTPLTSAAQITGGNVSNPGYTLADLGMAGSPDVTLDNTNRSATLTLANGDTVTLTFSGNGGVQLFGVDVVNNTIGAVVGVGTDSRSNLTIATTNAAGDADPHGLRVQRLLTTDNATFGTVNIAADLLGDSNVGTADLWIDGPVSRLTLGNYSVSGGTSDATWTGKVGGDVGSLSILIQGPGNFMVGGNVANLSLAGSTGSTSLNPISNVPVGAGMLSASVTKLAIDSTGSAYVFDSATGLAHVNIPAGSFLSSVFVNDAYQNQQLNLSGIAFNGTTLLGTANTQSLVPSVQIGSMNLATSVTAPNVGRLSAMAVDSSLGGDVVYAIQTIQPDPVNNPDYQPEALVAISTTGHVLVIGTLRDIYGQTFGTDSDGNAAPVITAMAYDPSGQAVYAVGYDAANDRSTLYQIQTTPDSNGNIALVSPDVFNPAVPGVVLESGSVPINGPVTGLAIQGGVGNIAGTIYAVYNNGANLQLATVDPFYGDPDSVLPVSVGVVDATAIAGMGFDSANNLVAYDVNGATGRLIQISTATGSSTPLTVSGALPAMTTFAVGHSGSVFNSFAFDTSGSGEFYVNPAAVETQPPSLVPANLLGGTLAGQFDVRAVTAAMIGGVEHTYAVVYNNNATPANTADDTNQLYEVSRDPVTGVVTGFTAIGNILDTRLPGPNAVMSINAIHADAGGNLWIVGTSGASTTQSLFKVATASSAIGNTTGVRATWVADLHAPANVTDPILALAFDSSGQLWGLRDRGATGQDLVEINTATGALTDAGIVKVSGNNTNLRGFDFDADGNLVALAAKLGDATNQPTQLVQINTATPAQSFALAGQGTVNPYLRGFSFDPQGRFISVYADGVVNNELWASPLEGATATLGRIDTATGQFLQLRPLSIDASGTPLTAGVTAITAAADRNAGAGSVFVLSRDGQLYEYSASDGSLIEAYGQVVNSDTGRALNITALEYQNGVLYGLGDGVNELVAIDLSSSANGTVGAASAIQPGALNISSVADIAYNPITQQQIALTAGPGQQFAEFLGGSVGGGGLTAGSIGRLTIDAPDGDYSGRVLATGADGIGSATVDVLGTFAGSVSTAGPIGTFTQTHGDFAGTLSSGGDIGRITLAGNDTVGSVLRSDGSIGSVSVSGTFDGILTANEVGSVKIGDNVLKDAFIRAEDSLKSLAVNGSFDGSLAVIGTTGNLNLRGQLGAAAQVRLGTSTGSVVLGNGIASGASLVADGSVGSIRVSGATRGLIATEGAVRSLNFGELTDALIAVGTDAGRVNIKGDVTGSVVSFGVWIGADGLYNTADDRVLGGSTSGVNIRGDYTDSVVTAGVLPSMDEPTDPLTPGLPSNKLAYSGYILPGVGTPDNTVDNATAGGILPSVVGSLKITGRVNNATSYGVVSAADGIGRVTGNSAANLVEHVYGDPIGAPIVTQIITVGNDEVDIYFSEPINTDSLSLSQDLDDNGVLDTQGTITLQQVLPDGTKTYLDDGVNLYYQSLIDSTGQEFGVVKVVRDAGFTGMSVLVTVSGGGLDGDLAAIDDRSGGRSALRDFNVDGTPAGIEKAFGGTSPTVFGEDPFGTILDGNNDGVEGGDYTQFVVVGDAPDTFLDAADAPPLPLNIASGQHSTTVLTGNSFSGSTDVDIFHFTADAWQYLDIQYSGPTSQVGLFVRDTQGTADPADDVWEIVTSWQQTPGNYAVELPDMALNGGLQDTDLEYDIVVAPGIPAIADIPGTVTVPVTSGNYNLSITLADSDVALHDATGVAYDQIAYLSSFVGRHNNFEGYLSHKQLVFVNFGGGTATNFAADGYPSVTFNPFDASVLDSALTGANDTSLLINGGSLGGVTVTGILDDLVAIYSNQPAGDPLGTFSVTHITDASGFAAYQNATSGLYFTSIDPATFGIDPSQYTTVFVGQSTLPGGAGFYAITDEVDTANMHKDNQIMVPLETFAGLSVNSNPGDELVGYATALANVIGHELGHALGLNHTYLYLSPNDLANNPSLPNTYPFLPDDVISMMVSGDLLAGGPPTDSFWQLGDAPLNYEFPYGVSQTSFDGSTNLIGANENTLDNLLRWLA